MLCVIFQKWTFVKSQKFKRNLILFLIGDFFHELIDKREREKYIETVNREKKDGKYLSVSFSGESNLFGKGTLRKVLSTNVTLYFPALFQAKELFSRYFKIIEAKNIDLPEKPNMLVKPNYFFNNGNQIF